MVTGLVDYFSKVKLEFSKVVWLTPKELKQLVFIVLIVTTVLACFFAVIDAVVSSLIMKIVFTV